VWTIFSLLTRTKASVEVDVRQGSHMGWGRITGVG
jgi:hypothetical protein